jgi:hypothetical protein
MSINSTTAKKLPLLLCLWTGPEVIWPQRKVAGSVLHSPLCPSIALMVLPGGADSIPRAR